MTRIIRLETECGERTCASTPGKFCRFVKSKNFGTEFVCILFDRKLFDEGGWLQRCGECLEEFGTQEG
jgi:hypothetical protein